MPTDPKLVNCDLCVLAYQNYHQAVIWPLDPWYEVLARGGSDRRTLFMSAVHRFATTTLRKPAKPSDVAAVYSGPAGVRALGDSNATLDPIITNHCQINPRLPAFTGDGSKFLVLQAPAYIARNIRSVRLASYSGSSGLGAVITDVRDYGDGTDAMIVFEGGTGTLKGSVPAYSPMGYVLKRYTVGDKWDAHIVFRGSRSGSAVRAIREGGGDSAHGNADWVTDMCSTPVDDPRDIDFAGGAAAHGFIKALRRCFPAILASLKALGPGAPQQIHVTGHSLGAALASTFCAALTLGSSFDSPAKVVQRELPQWPWSTLQGWFYALPPTGPKEYCDAVLGAMGGRASAPYCDGDPVVECSNSIGTMDTGLTGKVGWVMGSSGYTAGELEKLPKPADASSDENPHELYLIRKALVQKLGRAVPDEAKGFPWAVYETFRDALDGRSKILFKTSAPAISILTRENLRDVLQNYRFAHHFAHFLDMLKSVMENKGAYIGKHFAKTLAQIGENIDLARGLEVGDESGPQTADAIADRVGTQVSILCAFKAAKTEYLGLGSKAKPAADGSVDLKADDMLGEDFSARIGLGMLLSAMEKYDRTTMADYEKLQSLLMCLQIELS